MEKLDQLQQAIERESFAVYLDVHKLFPPGRLHHPAHLRQILNELSEVHSKVSTLLPED